MNKVLVNKCQDFRNYSNINNEELKNIACKAMVKMGRDFAREYIEIEDSKDVKFYLSEYINEILCEYSDDTYDWEIIKEYSTTSEPLEINRAISKFVDEIAEYVELED